MTCENIKPELPDIIFGTSCLGNLYQELPYCEKRDSVREIFKHSTKPVMLDSAGKYGAGLALESIGRALRELCIPPANIRVSNKLGWLRVPLKSEYPTFEPGAWKALKNDAELDISRDGILRCWEQGNKLLGAPYKASFVSVHDPDEYLDKAIDASERKMKMRNIIEAHNALCELKKAGEAEAVGIGAKDWRVIKTLAEHVELDWVMLACSLTLLKHPPELLLFIEKLKLRGIRIINSAVFHSGFLTGGKYFDYKIADPANDIQLFEWRRRFFSICEKHAILPAAACARFGMTVPGVDSVALNTSKPERVMENIKLLKAEIPNDFWKDMKRQNLISKDFPYAG